jgi:hypothetical protein
MLVPVPAEHSTKGRDVLIEIIFFHDCVRPNCLHQDFFIQNRFAVLDQIEQRVKRFGGQRQRQTIAPQQQTPGGVKTEIAELVDPVHEACACSVQNFSENFKPF